MVKADEEAAERAAVALAEAASAVAAEVRAAEGKAVVRDWGAVGCSIERDEWQI